MRKINSILFFMEFLLLLAGLYAGAFAADGDRDDRDVFVGEWSCVRASAGAITPLKYLEFLENGFVNVIVGECKGYGGAYELSDDAHVVIGRFQDVEIRGDNPMDESTERIARELLLEVEGNYEYRLSSTGKQLTLTGKRGAEFEFEKIE
jgi:hypothetical protein